MTTLSARQQWWFRWDGQLRYQEGVRLGWWLNKVTWTAVGGVAFESWGKKNRYYMYMCGGGSVGTIRCVRFGFPRFVYTGSQVNMWTSANKTCHWIQFRHFHLTLVTNICCLRGSGCHGLHMSYSLYQQIRVMYVHVNPSLSVYLSSLLTCSYSGQMFQKWASTDLSEL